MATGNPFDILGDEESDDMSKLIAKQQLKIASKKSAPAPAAPAASSKFPSKPAPPAQAARDARGPPRGGSSGGRGGFRPREFRSDKPNGFSSGSTEETGDVNRSSNERAPRQQQNFRGGPRRGGEDFDRPPRRPYERHISGTGRGSELKRDGSGRGNWGSSNEDLPPVQENEETKVEEKEKPIEGEEALKSDEQKENKEEVKEEPEDKEMTLEEYEKIKEEKRKALLAVLKTEERKVEIDKDLQSMQLLSNKKSSDPVFIKLGLEKDLKKKEVGGKKSVVSINEFLKPAEGERAYGGGGRRGGRGRGQMRGGFASGSRPNVSAAPAIADPSQFPTLGAK